MVLLYTRTQVRFRLLILSLCDRPFWWLSRRKQISSIFSNLKRFELKKTTSRFISTWGLYMNERKEKSIFQLLPPGVCLLEKFALKNKQHFWKIGAARGQSEFRPNLSISQRLSVSSIFSLFLTVLLLYVSATALRWPCCKLPCAVTWPGLIWLDVFPTFCVAYTKCIATLWHHLIYLFSTRVERLSRALVS